MLSRSVPLFLLLLAPLGRPAALKAPDPRSIVREVERAVAAQRTPALAARWSLERGQHPGDASALFAQATLERLTYRYPEASHDYELLKAFPAATGGRFRAFSALGEAEMFFIRALESEAGAASGSALMLARASRDSSAEVLALVNLGILRLRKASPEVALATFDSAARVVPGSDLELRARIHCGRASVLARTAREEAVTEAKTGARLARAAGARRVVANCLHVAASGYERLGRLYAADRLLDTAATLARTLGDRRELATILQWRGYAAFERQQLDSAQRLLGQAIIEGEAAGSISPLAWSALNLAEVSIALDDPISAEAHMTRALALMRQLGDAWGTTEALGVVAELSLASGDVDRASTLYGELNDRATRTSDAPLASQTNIHLAAIAARRRDWPRAAALLDSAGSALRRTGRPAKTAALPYEHGVVALWRGSPAEAERLFRLALNAADSGEHVSRYLAQGRLAAARLAQGDTADAERWLTTATDELDSWRNGLSDSTLRVFAFQVSDRFGGPELGSASVLAAVAASGHVAAAFELAERRRARMLRDGLLRARNAKAATSISKTAFALDASRVTLAAMTNALPAKAALVELVAGRGGQPTTAIVITKSGGFAVPIAPVDSMRNDIARFLAIIGGSGSDSAAAARLGQAILGRVVRRLPAGITDLILVPEDALHRVPFAALIVDGHRVVERFAVHVAPSAAIALSLWSARPAPGPGRMLAFGDARFPMDDARDPPATRAHFAAFASNGGLSKLSASATEVRESVRYFPRSLALLGADASESNLKKVRLDQYRLVHFATHAEVDERAPGRSAIALAAGGGEDGFVTSADLGSLRLDADLVMLSGCSTALGMIVGGEGILGLTGPLLQAGAHSVVATLWPVNDRASAEFVRRFYGFLAKGVAATDALRLAQLDAMQRGVPPRDWAAFVLTGDGFVRVGTAGAR
ncbi:MAG: CHAT domain-containing protein [Gemmatimonadota bacterium]|nr:CHAT domain-containing protein [Gemmatimonadota bacterium]